MPRTVVPHPEQVETQWLITVKKGTGLEVEYHFEMRGNCFTWAAYGLVLRSLFPVTVFWVVPWAVLRFED